MKLERIKVVRVGKPSSDAQGKIATVVAAVSEHFNQTTAFISNPRCMQIEGA
jgi:hypothetical protein